MNIDFEKISIDELLDAVAYMEECGTFDIRMLEALPGHLEARIDPSFKDKNSHMSSIRDYVLNIRKAIDIIKGSKDNDLFEPYIEIAINLLKLLKWEYIEKDAVPCIKSICRILLRKDVEII